MADIKIGRIVLGVGQTNCYFLYEEGKTDVIFIDPADKGGYLYEVLQQRGFHVAGILLTHGHFDHIWGVKELADLSGAEVWAAEAEKDVLESDDLNSSARVGRACTVKADHYVKDGDTITIAGMTCRMILTPGHTKGSCCYFYRENGVLIAGDTMFCNGYGRTDLPTGSMAALYRSMKRLCTELPDETIVYPGHGPATSIGYEKRAYDFKG